ncbi:MAG TPA: hypothetical protein VFV39_11215, partial [Limnobacter sp.]|nr:hypothetical protein [Limnobacter sp.]
DCSNSLLACIGTWPMRVAASGFAPRPGQPTFWQLQPALRLVEIEQAEFHVQNPTQQQSLVGRIDSAHYAFEHTGRNNAIGLGWRVQFKAPGIHNAMAISLNATPASAGDWRGLRLQADGDWGGFPWTGSAEQDRLHIALAQALGKGAPIVQLSGQNLRTYVRRNDAPETHQAAFSAQQLVGGLPAQPWAFTQAEWTYTHEDAQAWTFNLAYNPADKQLVIEPATIAGSEGTPAHAQTRLLNCPANNAPGQGDASYWSWQAGWFRIQGSHPGEAHAWVLCPAS